MEIKIESLRNNCNSVEIAASIVEKFEFMTPEEKEIVKAKYFKIVESVVSSFAFEINDSMTLSQMKGMIELLVKDEVGKDIRDFKIKYIIDEQKNS